MSLLSQLPILESIIPHLEPYSMKKLNLINRDIYYKKKTLVSCLAFNFVNDFYPTKLNYLLQKYPNVTALDLYQTGEEILKIIHQHPKINTLYIRMYGLVTLHTGYLDHIEHLNLSGSVYFDNIFIHIKKMKNLKTLDISSNQYLTNKGLKHLFQMIWLEELVMKNISKRLSLQYFHKLSKMSQLKLLDVRGTSFEPGIKNIFNQNKQIDVVTN